MIISAPDDVKVKTSQRHDNILKISKFVRGKCSPTIRAPAEILAPREECLKYITWLFMKIEHNCEKYVPKLLTLFPKKFFKR